MAGALQIVLIYVPDNKRDSSASDSGDKCDHNIQYVLRIDSRRKQTLGAEVESRVVYCMTMMSIVINLSLALERREDYPSKSPRQTKITLLINMAEHERR